MKRFVCLFASPATTAAAQTKLLSHQFVHSRSRQMSSLQAACHGRKRRRCPCPAVIWCLWCCCLPFPRRRSSSSSNTRPVVTFTRTWPRAGLMPSIRPIMGPPIRSTSAAAGRWPPRRARGLRWPARTLPFHRWVWTLFFFCAVSALYGSCPVQSFWSLRGQFWFPVSEIGYTTGQHPDALWQNSILQHFQIFLTELKIWLNKN